MYQLYDFQPADQTGIYTPQDSLALTRLMYDTRMSWGMKFAGEV